MRKQAMTFVGLAMIASLLGACGGTPVASPTSAPAATAAAPAATAAGAATAAPTATAAPAAESGGKSNVTLTYIASQGWVHDAEQELGKKFETETGIHVDYQIIPADQYFTVLQTKLNSNEGPDIFGGQSGKTDIKVNYNVEKNAVDLSQEEWVKREDPNSVADTSLDGKVYGLTLWDTIGGRWVVTYNKSIFQKLGLSAPKSYAEFMALCQKIKDSGVTPIYEPVSDGWHHVLWFPELGPRYEEVTPGLKDKLNANQAKFADNPTMLLVLQQLQEMYQQGFFGDNALADTFADTGKHLAAGDYAMAVTNLAMPADIQKSFPDAKASNFGFFVMPLGDNQISAINPGGPSKFIYSGSKHIDEAKQYFRFLTRPDNMQYLLDNDSMFLALNFPEVKGKYTPEQQAFLSAYPKTGVVYQSVVNYLNPQWIDIGKDLTAMFTGAKTPQDVLKTIDQRRTDLAKAAKDPAWAK